MPGRAGFEKHKQNATDELMQHKNSTSKSPAILHSIARFWEAATGRGRDEKVAGLVLGSLSLHGSGSRKQAKDEDI